LALSTAGTPGPLQRNVLKNHLALMLSTATRQAGRKLATGDPKGAASELAAMRQLLHGLRQEITGWSNDAELLNDEAVLAEYLTALRSPLLADNAQRRHLADSLRYVAWRKITPDQENLP
jgi:hypothetical protein